MPSRHDFRPQAILPPLVGLLVLAAISVYSAMQILGSAPLATATPAPSSPLVTAPAATRPVSAGTPGAGSGGPATPSPSGGLPASEVPASATPGATSDASLPAVAPTVGTATNAASDPGGVWTVSVRYPRLATGSTPNAGAVNASVADFVSTTLETWESGPAAVPAQGGGKNRLTGTFSVALATPRLVSFRLRFVDSTIGAEASTSVDTLTYDLLTGQPLAFGQIFADQPAALAILSAKSREQLRAQLGAAYDPAVGDEGTSASDSNFAGWALTPAGLEVTFREFQVAPASAGLPVVVVPWSDLASVVDSAGPAASLLR